MYVKSGLIVRVLIGMGVLLELTYWGYNVCSKKHGLYEYLALQKKQTELMMKLKACNAELHQTVTLVDCWRHDTFLIEQKARQDLQMARADETIFLKKKK